MDNGYAVGLGVKLNIIGESVGRIASLMELVEIKKRLELGIAYAAKGEEQNDKEAMRAALLHVRELTGRLQTLELGLWGTSLVTDTDTDKLGDLLKELETK